MKYFLLFAASCVVLVSQAAEPETAPPKDSGASGFFRRLFNPPGAAPAAGANPALASLSTDQLDGGIEQALQQGFQAAVESLGRTNGFLTNLSVHIPFPPQLASVERGLRKLGQDRLADDFEVTLNRAAEKAVPAAAGILTDTLKNLSIQDAVSLLTSPSQTAVTEYFRTRASDEIAAKFLPIVKEATSASGATAAYKELLEKVPLSRFSFFSKSNLDLDQFVTGKAMDGLFLMMGEEEKRIRENPQARTTELVQKVFGALQKQP